MKCLHHSMFTRKLDGKKKKKHSSELEDRHSITAEDARFLKNKKQDDEKQ